MMYICNQLNYQHYTNHILKIRLTIVITLIVAALNAGKLLADTHAVQDSLWRELARTTQQRDSVEILYNLYDISDRSTKGDVGMIIYDVASRMGDVATQLDILRNNTNIYVSRDSILAHYEKLVSAMPVSDDQQETLTFISVTRLSNNYTRASMERRQEMLKKLIQDYEQSEEIDPHARVRQLYQLCVCLGISAQGNLYQKYMEKLGELIQELPGGESHALRNMYLTQLAIIESYNERHEEAVKADKALLMEIEMLKQNYRKKKRVFRNYDVNEYLIYTRMLGAYPVLMPREVDEYYNKVLEIAARNNDVAKDLEKSKRATIHYLMAKKRYAEVLPILKEQVPLDKTRRYLRPYLRYMAEAAEALNDKSTQLYAVKALNKELEDYILTESTARYKELQILYDVNELKADNEKLQLAKQKADSKWHHTLLVISIVALVILVGLIIVLSLLYTRSRRLAVSLERSRTQLQNEKNHLLETQEALILARDQAEAANRTQTQFIQNMRHEILSPLNAITGFAQLIADSVPEEMQKEMDRYTEIISINSELLRTLVSDVLDMSKLESGEIKLLRQPVSLNAMCHLCVANVENRVKPGVTMSFVGRHPDDFMLLTDHTRVEQILINFLTNAAKYTEEGSITLDYEIDEKENAVIFSVTDTGPGIPPGKEEIIFNRFEKLSRYQQGSGLGLHICRFIAGMLGGTVKVDTSYKSGARFIFTLPID